MSAPIQVQVRRGPAAGWTAVNPVLLSGEIGFETDTRRWKVGDGITAWSGLPYMVDSDALRKTGPATFTGTLILNGMINAKGRLTVLNPSGTETARVEQSGDAIFNSVAVSLTGGGQASVDADGLHTDDGGDNGVDVAATHVHMRGPDAQFWFKTGDVAAQAQLWASDPVGGGTPDGILGLRGLQLNSELGDSWQVGAYHDAYDNTYVRVNAPVVFGPTKAPDPGGQPTLYAEIDSDDGRHSTAVRAAGVLGTGWMTSVALRVDYDEGNDKNYASIRATDDDGDTPRILYGRFDEDTGYERHDGVGVYDWFNGGTYDAVNTRKSMMLSGDSNGVYLWVDPDGLPCGFQTSNGGALAMLKVGGLEVHVTDDSTTTVTGYGDLTFDTPGSSPVAFAQGITSAVGPNLIGNLSVQGHLDLPSFTVATLPVTTQPGRTVFCSNARNGAETTGNGTGSIVQWSGGRWHIPGVATAVTA